MKTIFRKNLEKIITDKLDRSVNAIDLEHPGLIGSFRENLLTDLINEILPDGHYAGTGKISDKHGNLSKQLDLLIFNKRGLPPYLYSEKEGVFPIHGVSYAFEIKSISSKQNIEDAYEKANSIRDLDGPQPHFVFFAYDSDVKSSQAESDRILRLLPVKDPKIDIVCIVKKLYAYWHASTSWKIFRDSEDHNEIIGMIIGIINSLCKYKNGEHIFIPGQYLGFK